MRLQRAVERPARLGADAGCERGNPFAQVARDRLDARRDSADVAGELFVERGVEAGAQIGKQLAFHVRVARRGGEAASDRVDQADRRSAERAEHDRAAQSCLQIAAPRAARRVGAEGARRVLGDRQPFRRDRVEQRCQDIVRVGASGRADHRRRGVLRFVAQALRHEVRGIGGEASDRGGEDVVDEDVQLRTVAQTGDVGRIERARQRAGQRRRASPRRARA